MRRILFALVLLALIAPVAVADTPASADQAPAAEIPAAEAPADHEAPAEEPSLEALLEDVDPLQDAESKYICMDGCTNNLDCELKQEPAYCNYERVCDNPTGRACAGTCVCC